MARKKTYNKSSAKGKRHEARIVKLLEEFTSKNFRRVPLSGGWNKTGGTIIREESFVADVICDDVDFLFSVEAKGHYKDFSFTAILTNPTTNLFTGWWKQCTEDAAKHNLYPILFFKPNKIDDWIALNRSGVIQLMADKNGKNIIRNRDVKPTIPFFKLEIYKHNLDVPYLFRWKDIIEVVDPTRFFRG